MSNGVVKGPRDLPIFLNFETRFISR